jgi:hypothetical protein
VPCQARLPTRRTFAASADWTSVKEETSEVPHLEYSNYGAETFTLRKVEYKYTESFKMWC